MCDAVEGRFLNEPSVESLRAAAQQAQDEGLNAVFLTDGPSRTVKISPTTIQLRRTTPRNMEAAGRLSGHLMQALRELGEEHVTPARREHLKRMLPVDKRRELVKDLRLAPAWMHAIFRELAEEDA